MRHRLSLHFRCHLIPWLVVLQETLAEIFEDIDIDSSGAKASGLRLSFVAALPASEPERQTRNGICRV